VRRLRRRVAAVHQTIVPRPDPRFFAYARAVVDYGGGDPSGEGFDASAVGLAWWLTSERRQTPCGPG